jgi:DNA-binding NarL/FixJ family response regulator
MQCTCGQEIQAQWTYCPYCGENIGIEIITLKKASLKKRVGFLSKNYYVRMSAIKKASPRAYESWVPEEEQKLINLYKEGVTIKEIAEKLQRQKGAVTSRLKKIGER